jgi:hypothetical protein
MTLRAFVLSEGLKSQQVLSLHRFNELYRDQVMLDLHDKLIKVWSAEVRTAKAQLSKVEAEEALVQNPAALTKAVINHGPVKAHYGNKQVSPSVSIPLTLPNERRNLLEKNLLDATQDALEQLISHWVEAFSFERNSGKLATHFKIKRDDHSVRLVITGGEGSTVAHEAVICYVTVERGKPNTKRKAFDLVCLCTPNRDT